MSCTLVLGGARSGKSEFAEGLLAGAPALYIATGQAFDQEMRDRIRLHQDRRGPLWSLAEERLNIASLIDANRHRPILVDCLTLWISNLMFAQQDVPAATARLAEVLGKPGAPVVLVSSEVGLGLVPETALGRAFRDHQGRVNQDLAKICSRVVFVAAGLPLTLKDMT